MLSAQRKERNSLEDYLHKEAKRDNLEGKLSSQIKSSLSHVLSEAIKMP